MKHAAPSTLQVYRRNVYSQNGEDGVIAELIRRLGIGLDWFCEFGAWDGRYGSNCYSLLKAGWSGVMIEGEPARFRVLERLARRFPHRLHAIEAYVDDEPGNERSLDTLLTATRIPRDFAVLSIDIDSFDYQVWSSVSAFRPRIVVIEIESSIPPGREQVHDGRRHQMTSFSSMLALGRAKRYTLACHTGNMIFVRDEDVARLDLPREELARPESLFVSDWVHPTRLAKWRRKLHFMTPQRAWVKAVNVLHGT